MTTKEKIRNYLTIYWTMFKIGISTFGGGYAMVAVIDRELSDNKHWIDKEELLNYIAIAQITPGVIAVNVSTFVGRKRGGVPGAIFATLGVISPSIIIIMILAALITNFAEYEIVRHAFAGIRVCVCALIVNATIGFIKKTVVDLLTLIIFVCVFVTAAFTRVETVYIVLSVLLLSVLWTIIMGVRKKDTDALKKKSTQAERESSLLNAPAHAEGANSDPLHTAEVGTATGPESSCSKASDISKDGQYTPEGKQSALIPSEDRTESARDKEDLV